MKPLCQSLRLLIPLLACTLLWAIPAKKAYSTVRCTATMTAVNFGNVELINNVGLSSNGTLTYTCTNDNSFRTVQVNACFLIDGGQGHQSQLNPSYMVDTGNTANQLNFNLYWPDGVTLWTTTGYGTSTPYKVPVFMIDPAPFFGTSSYTGTATMPARIVTSQNPRPNTGGNFYQNSYTAGSTAIAWDASNSNEPAPATCGANTSARFPFVVSATVIKSCTVSANSNLQLGSAGGVAITETNITGNNSIDVRCTNTTPYFVGLSPSNNNMAGAGVMAAQNLAPVSGNSDTIPYQLRSTAGIGGTIWGNTASASAVGNGKAGVGNGTNQSISVYATTPNANFTPDSYADTVTVNVNY